MTLRGTSLLVEEPFERRLARRFHDEYEAAAPHFGYATRPETAVPFDELPESNRLLMEHVCRAITNDIKSHCIDAMRAARRAREPEAAPTTERAETSDA